MASAAVVIEGPRKAEIPPRRAGIAARFAAWLAQALDGAGAMIPFLVTF